MEKFNCIQKLKLYTVKITYKWEDKYMEEYLQNDRIPNIYKIICIIKRILAIKNIMVN